MEEPFIHVGIIDRANEINLKVNGLFRISPTHFLGKGKCRIKSDTDGFALIPVEAKENVYPVKEKTIRLLMEDKAAFSIKDVKIGINFHWEQAEDQTFRGDLQLVLRPDGTMAVINQIPLEEYLVSVISSEMGAGAPIEFLKAHAIASRSWLVSMLNRRSAVQLFHNKHEILSDRSVVRWYEREDHDLYDVCADDHCQRYQGIAKIISANAVRAVRETTGTFIVFDGEICDARFFKACGGLTEPYENVWEDRAVPYLTTVSDSRSTRAPIRTETEMDGWVRSKPDVFCNVTDPYVLQNILPDYDRETDFFRWQVVYERSELENIIHQKSARDIGTLMALEPLERGPSGRIMRLQIRGSNKTIIVGKELEIRRWLSPTHLLSSAFVISSDTGPDGIPARFTLTGAGWGHGVGMCQIGAAMMAVKGYKADDILKHYFSGATIERRY